MGKADLETPKTICCIWVNNRYNIYSSDTLIPERGRKLVSFLFTRFRFAFRYLNPREGTETGMMNEDYESFVKVQIP